MWCDFQVLGWAKHPDPEAAALGCGHSVTARVVATDVEYAYALALKQHPTLVRETVHVYCSALDIDVKLEKL